MFIVRMATKHIELRRSEMKQTNMSLRWSYKTRGGLPDYKHSIPDGILIDFTGPLSIDVESLKGFYLFGD